MPPVQPAYRIETGRNRAATRENPPAPSLSPSSFRWTNRDPAVLRSVLSRRSGFGYQSNRLVGGARLSGKGVSSFISAFSLR